jgi:hypothetical protein
LRANRFGSVAARLGAYPVAGDHGRPRITYLVELLPDQPGGGGGPATAERVAVGGAQLALDWLDAGVAPGEARRLGRRERLVEQTANSELVGRLLAEAGVDVDVTVDTTDADGDKESVTPLTHAAERGHLETVRLLLDAGADPDRMDGDGETPLMCAARMGRLEVLWLLLGQGAAMNVARSIVTMGATSGDGFTAFHLACFHNQAECAEALARAGCGVGIKDNWGNTGRELAEKQGCAAVVTRLRAVVVDQLRGRERAEPTEDQVMPGVRSTEKLLALAEAEAKAKIAKAKIAKAKAEIARLKATPVPAAER